VTLFIDLRATASGGVCAAEATVWEDSTRLLSNEEFVARTQGLDLVLATHGFNVDREHGIRALSAWGQLCELPDASLFVGVLWPGDSQFLPVLDYPVEGSEAIASGKVLARFLDRQAAGAASISFVSHSLGGRMILEALDGMDRNARRLILMAGAIEDDCLVEEYRRSAAKAREIYVLASKCDAVLQFAFPVGNLLGEILMRGHPYCRAALGREGPSRPLSSAQRGGAWQLPVGWDYGHLDYLPGDAIGPRFAPPIAAPGPSTGVPIAPPVAGWKSAWSAGAVSTQLS
jgi:hypothetical protein